MPLNPNDSHPLTLKAKDWKTMLINAAKLAAGAAITYALQSLAGSDWGQLNVFLVPFFAGAIDWVHRFLGDNVTR